MATARLQELTARVAAHNASKALLVTDPRWDKVTVSNTEIINSNLLALAQVLVPSLQLGACAPRLAQHAAASSTFVRVERVDFWYKGATENTEIINSNLLALALVLAPALRLTAVDGRVAEHSGSSGVRREPGKLLWYSFTAANMVVINANLRALALDQAAACAERWLACCGETEGLANNAAIKSAAENSEIMNANLIAFAQALEHVVVQVVPPLPDQAPPPNGCCLVM
jgi:hypothetical protein